MLDFFSTIGHAIMVPLYYAVSFVLVGIQGYTHFRDGNATVAKVAGTAITQAEWDAAHRSQVDRIRVGRGKNVLIFQNMGTSYGNG